jgi:hypothetical protein
MVRTKDLGLFGKGRICDEGDACCQSSHPVDKMSPFAIVTTVFLIGASAADRKGCGFLILLASVEYKIKRTLV